MLETNKFSKQEKAFLDLVHEDYVALAEVAGFFAVTNYPKPIEKEYLQALEFIEYLMEKYGKGLKYSTGPGDEITEKNPKEFIAWLKEMWYEGHYRQNIDYGVWFDLADKIGEC